MLGVTVLIMFSVFAFQAKVYFHFQYLAVIGRSALQFRDAVMMMLPIFFNENINEGSGEASLNARNTRYCLYAFWIFACLTMVCLVLRDPK